MQNIYRPFLIAVSGGIASGKTLVTNWFAAQGFEVHFADKIAHEILNEPQVIEKLSRLFGTKVIKNGAIDRNKLGTLVFADPNKLRKLNEIVHPLVYQEIHSLILLSSASYLVFEIPLLFENGLQNAFDLTINVFADKEVRIAREMKRNKLSRNEVLQRIASQLPDFDKQKLADVNIANNAGIDDLYRNLGNLLSLIKKLKKKEVNDILRIRSSAY